MSEETMKALMQDYVPPQQEITPAKVMCSAAGWYVGREYYDREIGVYLPWSRDSHYMRTRRDAEQYLHRNNVWDAGQ